MQNKQLIFFFVFISGLLLSSDLYAQESTIWLRNGKKIAISSFNIDDNYYDGKITFTTSKGKIKDKYLEEVFSVLDDKGVETILYEPKPEFGEILTPNEMKQFVLGISDARITPIPSGVFIGGIAAGLAGAFIPPLEVGIGGSSMPVPLGIFVPITYIGIMGATVPDADKITEKYPTNADNEHYLMGYQEGLKKKRLKNSILGSCAGFVAGILIFTAIN